VLVAVVVVVGVLEVVAGGAQRLEDDGGGLGGQDGAELVVQVAGRAPGELAGGPGAAGRRRADPPVRPGEALQLARGHRRGHLDQVRLGLRGDDPGQRPHLRVRHPARRELLPDQRVPRDGAGDPDLLAGGARGDLALPRQPGRARRQLPAGPPLALVEVRHQQQELARRRRQVPRQLTQPRLHPLQRLHRLTLPGHRSGHRFNSTADMRWRKCR
jgi:hypothetical protein